AALEIVWTAGRDPLRTSYGDHRKARATGGLSDSGGRARSAGERLRAARHPATPVRVGARLDPHARARHADERGSPLHRRQAGALRRTAPRPRRRAARATPREETALP